MSERDDNRQWLERGAERDPAGWESRLIGTFGVEGALDLFAVQNGDVQSWSIDLRRSPFRRDPKLKALVIEARRTAALAIRRAYELMWEVTR